MSNARARANQKLYHAKILIEAWRADLQREQLSSGVLEGAFGEAICNHLGAAYGWFLLEVAQPEEIPRQLPRSCSELPPVAEGLKTAPEILEFTQLEREPWLQRLLPSPATASAYDERAGALPASLAAAPRSLAMVATDQNFDPDAALAIHGKLQRLFDRMADSLDEY